MAEHAKAHEDTLIDGDIVIRETLGHSDEPTEQDLLKMTPYLHGFANFIQRCPTPMTAAIQGDWGSGKTSSMLAIRQELKDRQAWVIEFNTWQYSQFNLGEQLVFSLIGEVLTKIERLIAQSDQGALKNSSRIDDVKAGLAKVRKVLGPLTRLAVKTSGYGIALEAFDAVQEGARNISDEGNDVSGGSGISDSVSAISNLRSRLQELVHSITRPGRDDESGAENEALASRLYIFIDDLDRLEPERAVEVMEALKVFMNVEGCVFVLAIDFEVVLRGVRKKYGDDFEEAKARAFFDKIIQIPFNLPVGAYDISELLEAGLKAIEIGLEGPIDAYENLVKLSVGTNPRSIKRLLNTFGLLAMIQKEKDEQGESPIEASDNQSKDGDDKRDLFAILAFQTAFPQVFEALVREIASDGNAVDFVQNRLGVPQTDPIDAEALSHYSEWGLQGYRAKQLGLFLHVLAKQFGISSKKNADEANARLMTALEGAAVTSVGAGDFVDAAVNNLWATSLVELGDRIGGLPPKVQTSTRGAIEEFDRVLSERLGGLLAGDTGKYWGYAAQNPENVRANIGASRFLELHYQANSFRIEYGKYLSEQEREEWNEKAQEHGFSVRELPNKSMPPMSIKGISSKEDARRVAEFLAEVYKRQ
ncbi:KAP family P-loop NTPase fold protein [Trueperella pecoris]|uniref:KAP NTPase domain-containing protein n=1 Tax=Trueperella pecoris TaxID=2733571 RepID=A0A7M1QTM4_9ACTO|nr:P-loop NTPase fold protein [Trueperella pecoris]QOR45410.1 hypothetical protein INS88_09145 [Trueperella pecoris]